VVGAPAAPKALPVARDQVRPPLAEPKAARADPLLPKRRDPDAATAAAMRPPASDAPTDAGEPSISLTIGRIEVRPAPAPTPGTNAPVTTRPVIIKRASVRQTLDDYRSRQRR
jgi:hypothetical protein